MGSGVAVPDGPDDVQHLDARLGQRGRGRGHRLVEPARALGASGDQQRGAVRVEPERRPRLGAQRGPVQPGDQGADRQTDVLGPAQRGVGEADRDPVGDPGAGPVGQAGQRVLLVHDQRQSAATGREVDGHRDVAAVADDDVRIDPVEHRVGRPDRGAQPARHPQQVHGRLAGQRHGRDELERVAGGGDHAVLQPAGRAQAGHLGVRGDPAQRVGGRQQRRGVAGGTAACEEDAHRVDARRGPRTARRTGAGDARRERRRPAARGARTRSAGRARPGRAPARTRRTTPGAAGSRSPGAA